MEKGVRISQFWKNFFIFLAKIVVFVEEKIYLASSPRYLKLVLAPYQLLENFCHFLRLNDNVHK